MAPRMDLPTRTPTSWLPEQVDDGPWNYVVSRSAVPSPGFEVLAVPVAFRSPTMALGAGSEQNLTNPCVRRAREYACRRQKVVMHIFGDFAAVRAARPASRTSVSWTSLAKIVKESHGPMEQGAVTRVGLWDLFLFDMHPSHFLSSWLWAASAAEPAGDCGCPAGPTWRVGLAFVAWIRAFKPVSGAHSQSRACLTS